MASSSPETVQPPVPSAWAARASGLALAVFLFGGLASTLFAVASQRLDLLPDGLTRANFLSAAAMQSMAAALAKAPPARLAADLERESSFVLLRDLGPQVREGCRDWLFLAEELAPQADADAHLAARAAVVQQVRAALQKRGIGLLVAVVPDKSRIAAAHLCGLRRSVAADGRIAHWLAALRTAGTPVVDLTPPLQALMDAGQEPFLRTDTHWTAQGADAAARLLAQSVGAMGGLEGAPVQAYDVAVDPPARRPGDLVRLAGIDGLPLSLQPAPEEGTTSRFTARAAAPAAAAAVPSAIASPSTAPAVAAAATGDPVAAASSEADLFGDAALPTLALIGTSFSRTSHFADYLALHLGTPVPNLARDGGNFWGAASAYFNSPAFRDTPPKLVVWEIPERTLQLPTANEHYSIP